MNCYSLESIELPSSLTSIGNLVFNGCTSLQEISISKANAYFSTVDGALYDKNINTLLCCPGGKSGEFIVPSTVNEIGENAFENCTALESIELSASVSTIDNYAFFGCASLKSIELPSSLTSIGGYAFWGCESLSSIEFPASVTSIGFSAFCYCSSLESIELPSSVTAIATGAFSGCESLQEIFVSEANENYTSVDGVLYDKSINTLICCPGGKSGTFTVPPSVTSIGAAAFFLCTSLTSIEVPSTVSLIENNAFNGCSSLESIKLPSSVTAIDYYAFSHCESLKTITCFNPNPPILDTYAFYNSSIETVYVPNEAVENYKAADVWKEFNIVGIGDAGVEDIIFVGDTVENVTVYTLQGLRVKGVRTMDDVKSLTSGIYIVNGKKLLVK
jgi:hypothetical protein